MQDTQTRIAEEINESRSRVLEWRRNETQISLANQILQEDPLLIPQHNTQLDHSYAQPTLPDRPKLRLHSSWEPSPRNLEPLHNHTNDDTHFPWNDSDDDPLLHNEDTHQEPIYPWDDSEDEPTPPLRDHTIPNYPWSDSENSSELPQHNISGITHNSKGPPTTPSTTDSCAPLHLTSPTPTPFKESEDTTNGPLLRRPREPD